MKIEKHICDRCGNVIKRSLFSKIETINATHIFGFGPYDYANEKYELCGECTKALERFLSRKERTDEQTEHC